MNIQSLSSGTNGLLAIKATTSGKVTLKVLSTDGLIAKSFSTNMGSGNDELLLNMEDLGTGVYVINAFSEGRFVQSVRFVKM